MHHVNNIGTGIYGNENTKRLSVKTKVPVKSDAATGSARLFGAKIGLIQGSNIRNYTRIWVRISPFTISFGISLASWKKNPGVYSHLFRKSCFR